MYILALASPSKAGKNGGVHFGKLVKLLGNLAVLVEAIADAFRIAKGFLPVREFAPATKLLDPLVLVFELIALDYIADNFPLGFSDSFGLVSVILTASYLNYSILYNTSLSLSFGTF